MYIWIVIVNVDFVLHDCNQFWRTRCIRAAWFLKNNITLRLLSWRKQWDRAAVLCDLAPLWWAYLTVCVFERKRGRTALLHTLAFTPDKLHSHLSRATTRSLLHCCFIFSHFYLQIYIIHQREFVHPDSIFLACLVLSRKKCKMIARREGKGERVILRHILCFMLFILSMKLNRCTGCLWFCCTLTTYMSIS